MLKSLFEKIRNLFKKDKSHKEAMEALEKVESLDKIGEPE
jgi:hypothetical protein